MNQSDHQAALAAIVGAANVLTNAADQAAYLTDWRKHYTGRAMAIVRPGSTEEVAAVVRHCATHGIAIVPQGGNTGMAGGATPDTSGQAIVMSLTRMNRIRKLDVTDNSITVEAGCVLATIQQAAINVDRLFPLSLASEGSCTIGGNLSSNAGGTGVLRYGNTRDLCLGLEVVTANGDIIGARADGEVRGLRKDNTGYDLKDLFIGAEGTLGIITAATLKLYPAPRARVTAFAALATPRAALQLLTLAQQRCGATLTAFELISDLAISLVERHYPPHRSPFAVRHPYAVLMEISDHEDEAHATAMLEGLMEQALEDGLIDDAAIAQSLSQSDDLWQLRERVSEAQAMEGKNIKHDISVPISRIADFIETTDALIAAAWPGVCMVNFGHLGDGNLHYNVSPASGETEAAFMAKQGPVNKLVYDSVERFGGSISAEHGLGQLKREEILRYKPATEVALMRTIKAALDPQGIMNPGKVL